VAADEKDLARQVAERLVRELQAAVSRQGRVAVAVSGGRTPETLFQTLAAPPFQDQIPWARLHLFWVDERFVPPDHPDNNARLIRRTLLGRVAIPETHVHPVPVQAGTPARAAAAYEEDLKKFFGPAPGPCFDAALLGLGPDGHTASLFPGAPALNEKRRWVDSVDARHLPPGASHARVTLTFPALNASRLVLFVVSGRDKAAVLREVLEGPGPRYPAQQVQPLSGRVEWWADRAAVDLGPA
jgi:6-phosphogluconolactonase